MGINVFPIPSSAAVTPTGWTAGVAGTFDLSSTLAAGTYLIKTDTTQTMTITLQDSSGRRYAGTIRGGSGFITVATAVNQIIIPGSLTYPFGIEITPIAVTQLAAPTSLSLSLGLGGIITGTWGSVPAGATGATLFTITGDVLNFSSTASGATTTVNSSQVTLNATNQFVVAFKNSSGAYGIGATYDLAIPAVLPFNYEYLVVGAGGASGGTFASGGGGGAVKTSTTLENSAIGSSFTVNVAAQTATNTDGSSSTFTYASTTITATGGARGRTDAGNGFSGASGGGGYSVGSTTVYNGGTGTDGGNGGNTPTPNTTYGSAGGGGGAGGNASGWNSGNGVASSITGTSTYYAGGGAGGQYSNSGSAGLGGTARSNPGAANTGAGAGSGSGGGGTNCTGGSGVVIIAYPTAAPALTTIPGTLTYTVDTSTRSGYRVYKFTAGSGTVTI